jgi:glycosyltransferase involved in cell wall biosynthesis
MDNIRNLLERRSDVCMIVKNQLWNDARVKKEALTLSSMGLDVTIIAQPEEGRPESEDWDSIRILRVPPSGGFKSSMRSILDTYQGECNTRKQKIVSAFRKNPLKRFAGDFVNSFLYQSRLLRHAVASNASIYHAHDLDTLPVCAAAAWINSGKLIYDSHELWLESRRHLLETTRPFMFLEEITESILAPLADAVISVTPGRSRLMIKMHPNMRYPDLVANYPPIAETPLRSDAVRSMLGADGNKTFLLLYQGILGLHRGLEELIDASLLLRGDPVHIAMIGHDRSGGTIKQYAEDRNSGDMITFHPPVPSEQLAEITGSADAGLVLFQDSCLNHKYSLPNKLFEYMMSELPVIACDLPEISAVINMHDCGLLVDPSRPESIAEGIREMARDPEKARMQGIRGFKAAREKYTWSTSAHVLWEIYSRILNRELPVPFSNAPDNTSGC